MNVDTDRSREPTGDTADAAQRAALPLGRRLAGGTMLQSLVLVLVLAVVLYLVSTFAFGAYYDTQLATVAYYFTALAGLTVLTGLNGQISLGHGALMAIGAYATVLLLLHLQWPLAAVLAMAAVLTGIAGIAVGAVAARLRGPYLAGATLALAVGLPGVANRFPGFLGGSNGLTADPSTPPAALSSMLIERWWAWVNCACALVAIFVLVNLVRSRIGRTFRAVRDDEVAAEIGGLNVRRTQVFAFVVSSACAGLAGAMYAVANQSNVGPQAFSLSLSLALLTGIVIGGLGSLVGALWGAILLTYLDQWSTSLANAFSLSTNIQSNLSLAIYGAVLIAVILVAPGGIQGILHLLAGKARLLSRRRRPPSSTNKEGA